MPTVPPELQNAVRPLGVRLDSVLRRTEKTVLAVGDLAGVRVAVKYSLDPDPFWIAKWRHELDVYEVFAALPPPIPVPRLIHTDGARLLVLEWLDGRPLDDQRYPDRVIAPAEIDAALSAVTALNRWRPAQARFTTVFDYAERVSRYHDKGYLTDADSDTLTRLLAVCGTADQVNHGDALASNILVNDDSDHAAASSTRSASLVDWEFAGLFLPGFDLAMMHTQLGARTPAIRERIDAIVEETDTEFAFVVNLATVITRELRIHLELPGSPLRQSRIPLIEAAWDEARDRLHRSAARRP